MADQVRGIALEGLKYAKAPYDKARYERVLATLAQFFKEYRLKSVFCHFQGG